MANDQELTESPVWLKLLEHVGPLDADDRNQAQLKWIKERVHHYSIQLGIPEVEILTVWEEKRGYWYMNYYQDCHQPVLGPNVRVFDTLQEFKKAVHHEQGFRCPNCHGVSHHSRICDSGLRLLNGKVCAWKSFGIFGTMDKGAQICIKDAGPELGKCYIDNLFMPIAWETTPPKEPEMPKLKAESTPNPGFNPGDLVVWESQAQGSWRVKVGRITHFRSKAQAVVLVTWWFTAPVGKEKVKIHTYRTPQAYTPRVSALTRYDSTTPYYAEIQVAMTKSAKAAANSQGTNE